MRIELTERGSDDFYKEVINIGNQYGRLMNSPRRKIQNLFKSYRIYAIVCSVVLLLIAAMCIAWGMEALDIVFMSFMVVCIVFSTFYIIRFNKTLKDLKKQPLTSVLEMNEEGISNIKGDGTVNMVEWDQLAFVRVFHESVCFIARKNVDFIITVNIKYKDQIVDYLKANQPKVRIIFTKEKTKKKSKKKTKK